MLPPRQGDDWFLLTSEPLPVDQASAWAAVGRCGAVVSFCGTARDHADGGQPVDGLSYEAYPLGVARVMRTVADGARSQWPEIGRTALLHRIGALAIGDAAVVVAVSAPHRQEAFAAARWCIDTLKDEAPIWKREHRRDGDVWLPRCEGVDAPPGRVPAAADGAP